VSGGLPVAYYDGTHRSQTTAATLARITPSLAAMRITRAGDITGLDRLGVPVWFAVRPYAKLLQVSNGKGIDHEAARVSALMEAVELWHAEWPTRTFRRAATRELRRERAAVYALDEAEKYVPGLHFTEDRIVDWVEATLLHTGEPAWVPAATAFVLDPCLRLFSANGLASGNHLVEATLHALYEVVERDAVSRLSRGGLSLPSGQSRVVDLDSLPPGAVADLRDRIRRAGATLVVIHAETIAPLHAFWAVLVDPASPFPCTSVNMGHGCHLSPEVAAIRAVTEAAQSRLTFIHGSREDLSWSAYQPNAAHDRLRDFFLRQVPDLRWSALTDSASGDLSRDLDTVLDALRRAGHTRVLRVDLTQPQFGIPVVKVAVPGLSALAW